MRVAVAGLASSHSIFGKAAKAKAAASLPT